MSLLCPKCGASLDFVNRSEDKARCPACESSIEISHDSLSTRVFPSDQLDHLLADQSRSVSERLHLGRFALLEEIGQGGFGKVFRAHDTRLNRIVALKIPHSQTFVSPEERSQFLREGQKAAKLEHPGIVQVYDADEVAGVPYIASRFIRGNTLAHYSSGYRIPYRECASIVSRIADALQHAHEHQLVHRDIKPGNIMIDGDGTPLLMDFGLAIDVQRDDRMTSDGRVKGTVAYMSPEQAAGENKKIDFRTDIYSLGVVLFELLTGERPFHGVHQKIIDQIRLSEPRQLRSFNIKIPADLQTICQKAMEKDVSRRYETAREFSQDLQRWLNNEPIRARRIGRMGRLTRWCRRNPGATISLSSIFLILVVATGVVFKLYLGERAALVGERRAALEANQRASRLSVTKAEQFIKTDLMAAVPWLAEAYRIDKDDPTREPNSRLRLQCALRACPRPERVWFHDEPIEHLTLSGDRRRFASASTDGVIRVWDAESGKQIREFRTSKKLGKLKFCPDGRHLVSAGNDLTVQVWNIESDKPVAEWTHRSLANDLEVSPTGDIVATGHVDNRARLWRWQNEGPDAMRELEHAGPVFTLAFNSDGTRLASGGYDEAIRIWDPATGKPLATIPQGEATSALRYSHRYYSQRPRANWNSVRITRRSLHEPRMAEKRLLRPGESVTECRIFPPSLTNVTSTTSTSVPTAVYC